jgi:hypothetical protein
MKEEIKKRILEAVTDIPAGYRSDDVIKETIRCVLFGFLKEQGLIPVPAFQNPRYPEGPVDIAGVTVREETKLPVIEMAFCSSPVIELQGVKSLDRVPCEKKIVITYSTNTKKVEMTTFYLKTGIEHIHIQQEETKKA